MKVCHITSVHPYNDTRIFLKECQTLSHAGFETHLIAPNAPNDNINGVVVHGIGCNSNQRIKRMTNTVRRVFKKAIEIDADLYHFHDPELIPIGLKLKKKGKKVIYDIHEDVPRQILSKYWIKKGFRSLISKTFEKYENYAAKRFDAVVTATPIIHHRFLNNGCHSFNINNYPIKSELYQADTEWGNKENAVCYVGGITKIRGIAEMVDAIAKTKANLLLGGTFANENEKNEVEKLEGWNQVHQLGYLDRKKVSDLFSKSMAGLVVFQPLPNHIDAQPNKMFEYMSAGLPVIASHFSLWREIIENNQCGLCVHPLDANDIAQAIDWIIAHPAEAKKMGQNGREAIERKYNWEDESKTLLKLYEELAI